MPSLANIGYDEILHSLMVTSVNAARHTELPNLIRELAGCWVCLYGFGDASEINTGTCDDFAHDVMALWPDVEAIWYDVLALEECQCIEGTHCVIVCGGRYYDSECPDGVGDWMELPYFRRFRHRR